MSAKVSLRHGRPLVAIPGPSVIPDRVLSAMHTAMPNIYEGALVETSLSNFADLPAIAQEPEAIPLGDGQVHHRAPGEALHPEREPLDLLQSIKADVGTLVFNAQYLQRPVPLDGNLIKWKWFRVYAHPPAHNGDGRVIQSWDTASKAGELNDYSACTTWLVSPELPPRSPTVTSMVSPPAMRAISSTRWLSSSLRTVAQTRPAFSPFSTRKCTSAKAAIWGRWVMQRT